MAKKFVVVALLLSVVVLLTGCNTPVTEKIAEKCDVDPIPAQVKVGTVFYACPTKDPVVLATVAPTQAPQDTTVPQENSEQASQATEVNINEPLNGTLDDFGNATRYDDRFPLGGGMIWDQSYNTGEIFVSNMYAAHDHDFKSQNGCVIVYHQAPSGGSRIRFTAWDGMGFELNADSGYSLSQAIAAMRETLVRAHGCSPDSIQYHETTIHGDPVK